MSSPPPPAKRQRREPAAPPIGALCRNNHESIFTFLTFRELLLAVLVSRLWCAAAYAIRGSQRVGRRVKSARHLGEMLESRIAQHHLTSLCIPSSQMVREQMQHIASRLPLLRRLEICASRPDEESIWSAAEEARIVLPPELRLVDIHFHGASAAVVHSVLRAVSSHANLSHLDLDFGRRSDLDGVFAHLLPFPALESLRIRTCPGWHRPPTTLSAAQVQDFRALRWLKHVDCDFSEQTMTQLLQPGPQWTSLQCIWSDAFVDLLPALPLSSIVLSDLDGLSSLDFLAELPHLRRVAFRTGRSEIALLHELSVQLPQLTELEMVGCVTSKQEMQALLRRLPKLLTLHLSGVEGLSDLRFLEHARGLQRLGLFSCDFFVGTEVFIPLEHCLTELRLMLRGDPLHESVVAAFQSRKILPKLECFDYRVIGVARKVMSEGVDS
jgi:hypothetical protein